MRFLLLLGIFLSLSLPGWAQFSANSDAGYSTLSYPIQDGILKLKVEMLGAKAGKGANDGSGIGASGGNAGRVSGIFVIPAGVKGLMLGGYLGEIGSDGTNANGSGGGAGGGVWFDAQSGYNGGRGGHAGYSGRRRR
jgi:hypothetical protein